MTGRGRPRITDPRSAVLQVCVTEAERDVITEAAESLGLTASAYVRGVVLTLLGSGGRPAIPTAVDDLIRTR